MSNAESFSHPNHPELDGSMPVDEMEDALGPNFYELDYELNKEALFDQLPKDHRSAREIISTLAAVGNDEDIYALAGTPEEPGQFSGKLLEAAANMRPEEREALEDVARYFVIHAKGKPAHPKRTRESA